MGIKLKIEQKLRPTCTAKWLKVYIRFSYVKGRGGKFCAENYLQTTRLMVREKEILKLKVHLRTTAQLVQLNRYFGAFLKRFVSQPPNL